MGGYGSPGMGYGTTGMGGSGGAGMGMGAGYGSAGPSSGLGGYPGATNIYGSLPYTYPQPLFGRLDEPFFGFEPPPISYPAWWGPMSAVRIGQPGQPGMNGPQQAQQQQQQQPGMDPNASMPAGGQAGGPSGAQAVGNLPDGTIDMAIDGRGVATLRGAVPSLAERITLGQKVARTPGVTQVVNLLNVRPGMTVASVKDRRPPPAPLPGAGQPGRSTRRGRVGCPTPAPAPNPTGAQANNDGLPTIPDPSADPVGQRATRAVASRSGLANSAIKVKVRDGVATITGRLPSVYEAMLAYRAVQRTPGVREIDDRLEFVVPDGNGPNPLADLGRPEDVEPYLEAQIRRQVGDLAHVDRGPGPGRYARPQGTLEREDDRTRFDAILRSMPILRGFRVNAEMPAEPR